MCKFLLTFIIPESTIYTATTSLFGEELLVWSIVLHLVTIFIMLLFNDIFKLYYINNNITVNKIKNKIRVGGPISRRIIRFYYYYIWLGYVDIYGTKNSKQNNR